MSPPSSSRAWVTRASSATWAAGTELWCADPATRGEAALLSAVEYKDGGSRQRPPEEVAAFLRRCCAWLEIEELDLGQLHCLRGADRAGGAMIQAPLARIATAHDGQRLELATACRDW